MSKSNTVIVTIAPTGRTTVVFICAHAYASRAASRLAPVHALELVTVVPKHAHPAA